MKAAWLVHGSTVLIAGSAIGFLAWSNTREVRHPYSAGGPPISGTVTPQLCASTDMAMLVAPDGSLWSWGERTTSNIIFSETPIRFGRDRDWKSMAIGMGGYAAIKTNGTLWTSSNGSVLAQLDSDTNWVSAAVGGDHMLFIKRDGSVWATGGNSNGEIGDGTKQARIKPVPIAEKGPWKQIVADWQFSCGLKEDGTIWTWGRPSPNQNQDDLVPTKAGDSKDWIQISGSRQSLFAIRKDGSLWIGAIFYSGIQSQARFEFRRVGSDTNWVRVIGSRGLMAAQKSDGSWWMNDNPNHFSQYQEYDGRSTNGKTLKKVPFPLDPWTIAVGVNSIVFLTRDGQLWNYGGRMGSAQNQIGIGVMIDSMTTANAERFYSNRSFDNTPHFLGDFRGARR